MMIELALAAYVIDRLFGELPCKHPVMFMGDFIQAFENHFYQDNVARGAILVCSLISVTWTISFLIEQISTFLPQIYNFLFWQFVHQQALP